MQLASLTKNKSDHVPFRHDEPRHHWWATHRHLHPYCPMPRLQQEYVLGNFSLPVIVTSKIPLLLGRGPIQNISIILRVRPLLHMIFKNHLKFYTQLLKGYPGGQFSGLRFPKALRTSVWSSETAKHVNKPSCRMYRWNLILDAKRKLQPFLLAQPTEIVG